MEDELDSSSGMKTSMDAGEVVSALKKGDVFAGRYEILADGLKGGMGMVYKVKDTILGDVKALKLILPQFLGNEKAVSRFKQEVAITQKLLHENIVRVFDIGESEGALYFTMEWVDGISLRDLINERKKHNDKFSLQEAIYLTRQICSALAYAHKSIIHRDIKPENIMVVNPYSKEPMIRIMDFGIAKADSQALHASVSTYMGTPIYMAPEQYTDAANADKRADIYSVGVMLYELLTLSPPLGSFSMPSELDPSIPKKVDEVIKKALSPDRNKRYDDAMMMVDDLERKEPEVKPATLTSSAASATGRDLREIEPPRATAETQKLSAPAPSPQPKSNLVPVIIAVVALIVAGVGYVFFSSGKGKPTESVAPQVTGTASLPQQPPTAPPPTEATAPGKPSDVASLPPPQTRGAPQSAVPQERVAPPPSAAVPFELHLNVIGQRNIGGNNYEEVQVTNGAVLKTNDNLQIHLMTTKDCYVYVILFDSEGRAGLLFPSSMAGLNNKVKANKPYHIPSGNKWFFLDDKTGTETIYVIANLEPMQDIAGLLANMEKRGRAQQREDSQKILERTKVLTRGVSVVAKGGTQQYKTTDGDVIKSVTEVVKGAGSLVWSVSFKHI